MQIWFTSDLHLGHDKSFIYEPRGFNNIEEMNEAIIKNWNSIIQEDDIVYILGDIMLGDNDAASALFKQLNGYKKIILGNHDTLKRFEIYITLPNTKVIGYADMFNYRGYHFYLSHYPTITANLDIKRPLKKKVICLCGHTHDCDKFYQGNLAIYNVALDAHDCRPVSIEQIIEDIKQKEKNVKEELLFDF